MCITCLLQVVLLGAGYDSRPWRLALPPPALHTVKWFEVDHASVIMRKQILLQQAGAQINIPTTLQQRHSISSHAQDRPIYLSDCSMEERDANVKHPLRVHAWTAVAADLEKPGWSSALVAAGFSPFERTVWVLEGLLYYFEPTSVPRCLQVRYTSTVSIGTCLLAAAWRACGMDWIVMG